MEEAQSQAAAKKKIMVEKLQNLQKNAVKLVKQLTLNEKSKKLSQETKLRTLSDLNAYLMQIDKISPMQNQMFADDNLLVFVRHFLIENTNNNKIPPLEFFRLVLVSESIADKFLAYSIPLFISRVIERDDASKLKPTATSNFEEQVFEALRLIKHWVEKFPKKFPQYLAFCLVALAELPVPTNIEERKKDQIPQHIKLFAIDIMLALSVRNTRLCCICGGFNLLVNSITDPCVQEKSYDIISKMLIFINDPRNRDLTAPYIDFKRVFHVLTDLDNVFVEEVYKSRNNLEMLNKFETKLNLGRNAIVTLLKSWVGLIYVCNDPAAICSLLETLKQIPKKYDSMLRNIIFEALEEIITVGDNMLAVSNIEQKHCFKISSLVGCYLMTVIELLIEQNLLRILIELSGVEESFVCEPAQKLLKRLTLLIFNYRPQSSKYIDFLITAANKASNNSNQMLKTSSSFVINKIGNYIYDRKEKKNHTIFNELENLFSLRSVFIPHSRASLNSISKTLNFISYKEKNDYRKDLLEKDPIPKDHKQNYNRWKWDIIENLLQFPDPDKFKPSTNQRYRENKMYKYLLRFYSPSRGNFFKLDWHLHHFTYIKVGQLLSRNSITIPENLPLIKNPPESQFECTVSFIGDLEKLLETNIKQCIKDSNAWNIVLCTKLQRELLTFIGLFSETKVGYESLICQNRFLELLKSCMGRQQCSHLVYLVLVNFDFYRDDILKLTIKNSQSGVTSLVYLPAHSPISDNYKTNLVQFERIGVRNLLEEAVRDGSHSLKLACVQIIKILLKTEVEQFLRFSYKLLIHILSVPQQSQEIVQSVVEFLEQNLASKNNIKTFLKVLGQQLDDFSPKILNMVKTNSDSSSNNGDRYRKENEEKKNVTEEQERGNSLFPGNATSQSQNKIKFEDIKSKLTNPILIRLLSHDSGIELAEKYFPDWLDQQFRKWMSPDHYYCTSLENKLNGALNFTKKKEKGYYKITSNSHVYDLLFMYKLPWVLQANDQKFPLWIRQKGQSYQLHATFAMDSEEQSMYPKLLTKNDSLKISLGIGTMLVDEQFNIISNPEDSPPLTIFLSMSPKTVNINGCKMYYVQSSGVEVYYRKYDAGFDKNTLKDKRNQMSEQEEWEYYNSHVQDLNKLIIYKIVINVKLPTVEHSEELPLHLINELAKTQKGREFIEKKNYVEKCGSVLTNYIRNGASASNLVQVRSILWSLGFYGAKNQGIKVLHRKQVFHSIIHMTFQSPTLSIRGTCRYILNMFCHSEYGRNLLVENGFNVNNRCFTCYPTEISKFYAIDWPRDWKRLAILDQKYWRAYDNLQKPMTKNEEKLFQLISLLINSLSFKSAVAQIRQILKISPKIVNSLNLLQNVINLLTFFKYKHESRKSIINIFDEVIKGLDFSSEVRDKIVFYVSEEETRRKMSIDLGIKSQTNLDHIKMDSTENETLRSEQILKV